MLVSHPWQADCILSMVRLDNASGETSQQIVAGAVDGSPSPDRCRFDIGGNDRSSNCSLVLR